MARKKLNNRIIEIKPEFESILVCGDRKLCPFIQILIQEPENVDSHNLGTLVGVFEVLNSSEDSSYIVNYLVSIIKKEYFSKPKRGPIESLEASLHKANLALSNLAEHGNIDWLGNLNALVAVTEKNGLHFSQAGTASAFLLRSKMLTDISDGLSPADSEPNPLKTFINVSSGRMEKDDKLIITTASIFDIFSLEEIKKSSLRFPKKEFVQFLRTALGNELERAAVLIADFSDKEVFLKTSPTKKISSSPLNVFSNDAFIPPATQKDPASQTIEQALHEEIQKSQSGFVDKKTGHIYIKENLYENDAITKEPSVPLAEKMAVFRETTGLFAKKIFVSIRQLFLSGVHAGADYFRKITAKKPFSPDYSSPAKTPPPTDTFWGEKFSFLTTFFSTKNKALLFSGAMRVVRALQPIFSRIAPSLQKIKKIFLRMDYQQRLYGLLILVLIFIVPIFIARYLNGRMAQKNVPASPAPVAIVALPLEKDVNVVRVENPAQVYSSENILNTVKLNDRPYLVTATQIVDVEKNTKFSFPSDFGTPTQTAGMSDLNLLFLINANNRLISFSPTAGTFSENSLSVPQGAKISAMGTYLTYLYLADAQSNKIYRYPRSEGGFGEKTDWLKEDFNLNNILDFSINENVFIAKNNSLSKLFRGRSEPFVLETSTTPVEIAKISIDDASANMLLLDKAHSRIVYLDKDGRIIKQYYHPELQKANDVIIDEKNNLLYFSTETALKTIPLI